MYMCMYGNLFRLYALPLKLDIYGLVKGLENINLLKPVR